MPRSQYVVVSECEVIRTTELAICVSFVNDDIETKDAWIPRSAIHELSEIEPSAEEGDEGDMIVKRWVAEQKDLPHEEDGWDG